ncbi:MarR family winged helix-turn-helix transcriptional regulator [Cohnella caldifontis]|uniref:MarR family winged helix-turn-helix transcriptional regulator n=1 Tax=Cohnella caldifontis TaxID=3027471 RepID=UPI0023ECB1C2|nr:MarR family transcriptional regulator [Cohnella sp. YIM B05605]
MDNREHPLGLDHSLGFALGVSYRKISALLASRLRPIGLTPEQWSVLARISEKDGQIQKEIAERAGKDKPTTTRILDGLEAKGFITRKIGPSDRRSFEVSLTEQGRNAAELAAPVERDTIREACAGFTAEQYRTMMKWLDAINSNVDRILQPETE